MSRGERFTTPRKTNPATCASIGEALYTWWKTPGKLAGWLVKSSSDGTTYNSSGDQITSGSSGAGGFNNANAWVRWQAPGAVEGNTFEYCLQVISTGVAVSSVRLKFSPSAGFTGGSPSATQAPSATDEQVLLGGGSDASPTGTTIFSTLFNQTDHYVMSCFDDAAPYGFWVMGMGGASGAKQPYGVFLHDPIQTAPHGMDASPFLCYAKGIVNTFASANYTDAPGPAGYGAFGTANQAYRGFPANSYNTAISSSNVVVIPGTTVLNQYNGLVDLLPVLYSRSTAVANAGIKGFSSLVRWIAQGDAEPRELTYNSGRWIRAGNAVLAWDGTTPGGWSDDSANEWGGSVLGSAPVVDGFTPAGTTDLTLTGLVEFDVASAAGIATVLISVLRDGRWEDVATDDSFYPLYDGAYSARTGTSTAYHFAFRREPAASIPYWDSDTLTVRVVAIDVDGQVTTETYSWTAMGFADASIENLTPAADSDIDPTDTVEFDLIWPGASIGTVRIYIRWLEIGLDTSTSQELFFESYGTKFGAAFTGNTSAMDSISDGYHVTMERLNGWAQGFTVEIDIENDTSGETAHLTFAMGVPDGIGNLPSLNDGTNPSISNLTPTPGTVLEKFDFIEFDLGDGTALADVIITCQFDGEADPILVFDGEGGGTFYGRWVQNCTITPDSTVYGSTTKHFKIQPVGGWYKVPSSLKINGFDVYGNKEGGYA